MSNVEITPGIGQTIAADAVDDATLGNASVQFVKLMDGTLGSTNKAAVNSSGQQSVSIDNNPVLGAGSAVIGALVGNQTVQVTNTVPVSGNVSLIGNQTISGNVGLLPGNATIGTLLGNQTVVVTSGNIAVTALSGNVAITGNVGLTGNVTLGAGSNSIGNIANVGSVSGNVAIVGNLTSAGNITSVGGNVSVIGPVAGNATVAGNPVQTAHRAVNVEAVSNGNNTVIVPVTDVVGKTIVMPYANKENMVRGTATTGNTSVLTVIAAQGAGNRTYITGLQLGNTGNNTVTVTMSDSASSVFIVPNGGGSNIVFNTPLVTAGNTAFTATASGNTTSLIVSAQGYLGS